MRKYLIILLALAATLSCRHRLDPVNDGDTEVQIQSTFDPDAALSSAPTRATNTDFQKGDQIGLYMVNYNGANPAPLTTTGCQENNVLFTSNELGVPIANPPVRYKKDYKGKLDLYAYYPRDDKMLTKDVNAYAFEVQQDQSKGITTSDFCRTKTTPSIVPTSSPVPLLFKHMLSKINLTLNLPREYKDGLKIDSIVKFSFMGVVSDVKINIGAGTLVNGTTTLMRLNPLVLQTGVVDDDVSKSKPYVFEMIAPAQAYAVGKLFLEAVIRFDNGSSKAFEFVATANMFGNNSTKAGKVHYLNFSVDPGLELSFKGITITDWLTGTSTTSQVDAAITTKFSVGRQDFEPSFDGANRVRVLTDDNTVYDIKAGVAIAGGKCGFSFTPESGAPRDYGFRIVELEFLRGNTSLYKRQFISPRVYDPVSMDLGLLPFSGAGTEASPYLIATAADLDNVRLLQGVTGKGKFFRQTADIDLAPYLPIKFVSAAADGSTITFAENTAQNLPYIGNHKIGDASGAPIDGTKLQGGWVPIGHNATGTGILPAPITDDYVFYGNYDGAGYAISNLLINRGTADQTFGLFASIAGTLENIILKAPYISASRVGGALTAGIVAADRAAQNGSVIMCEVRGGVVRTSSTGDVYSGGIVGLADDESTIRGCMNSATVYSAGSHVGGISGANTGTLEGCLNTGSVKGLTVNVGGVTGLATRNGVTSYSYNRGNVAGAAATTAGAILGVHDNTTPANASNNYWLSTATYANCGPNGYGTSTFAGSVSGFAALTAADMLNRNQNDPTGLLYKLNQGAVKWQIAPTGHWNAGWPIPASIGEPERPRLAGVANCYMMQPGSTIAFDATACKAYFSTPNAAIGSVKILWQTARNHGTTGGAANMILNASALSFDATKGIVSVTANGGAGNAVVAAYSGANGAGAILWSWHIWVTATPGHSQALPAANQPAAGGPGKLFMDRNIGAITNAQGNVGAYGMFYQWGRKDPFTPSIGMPAGTSAGVVQVFNASGALISTNNDGLGNSFKYLASNADNLLNAIKNPMTHYYNSDNNWTNNAAAANTYWRAPATAPVAAGYVDNRGDKGVYDPCPVGYRIAANGAYAGMTGRAWTMWDKSGGTTWLGTWWPAAGYRNPSLGTFGNAGVGGSVWSSSPQSAPNGYNLYFDFNGGVGPSGGTFRGYGFSVRCVQD